MAGDSEYKQLLDVSRTLSEVASELKKTNRDLESIAKSVSKDLPREIKKVADSQKETVKSLNESRKESAKSSAGDKSTAPLAGGDEAAKGRERLKAMGLEDFMGMYEDELAKLSAAKTKSVKGGLKNGGTIKEGGNYVVGENGPEVVTVPKNTNVMPLNISDMIEGLDQIDEIKKYISKEGTVKAQVFEGVNYLLAESGFDRVSLESLKDSFQKQIVPGDPKTFPNGTKISDIRFLEHRIKKAAMNPSATLDGVDRILAERDELKKSSPDDPLMNFYPSKDELEKYQAELLIQKPELAGDSEGLVKELRKYAQDEAGKRSKESAESGESKRSKKNKEAKAEKSESQPTLESKLKKGSESEKSEASEEKKEKSKFGEKIKSGLSSLIKPTESGKSFDDLVGFGDNMKGGGVSAKSAAASLSAKATSNKTAGSASGLLSKKSTKAASQPAPVAENKSPSLSVPKKTEPQPQPAPAQSAPMQSSEPAKTESSSASMKESTPAAATSNAPTAGAETAKSGGSSISSQDLDQIKGLLANISRSLSGPLNIYNPDPFRPDSRRI